MTGDRKEEDTAAARAQKEEAERATGDRKVEEVAATRDRKKGWRRRSRTGRRRRWRQ